MNRWRKIQYTDDGCERYQCLECKDTWEARTPADVWSYCPNCGTRWLGQLECRNHEIPRWYFDRYGNRADYDAKVKLTTGEHRADDVMYRGWYAPPTHQWQIESRGRHYWSDWTMETRIHRTRLSEAAYILSALNRERAVGNGPRLSITDYRVRLVKCV